MRYKWDIAKNNKLKSDPRRGMGFEVVLKIFERPYFLDRKCDDPEQYRAIGFAGDKLVSVIIEYREDDDGEFIHLVTYWPATKAERELYEKS